MPYISISYHNHKGSDSKLEFQFSFRRADRKTLEEPSPMACSMSLPTKRCAALFFGFPTSSDRWFFEAQGKDVAIIGHGAFAVENVARRRKCGLNVFLLSLFAVKNADVCSILSFFPWILVWFAQYDSMFFPLASCWKNIGEGESAHRAFGKANTSPVVAADMPVPVLEFACKYASRGSKLLWIRQSSNLPGWESQCCWAQKSQLFSLWISVGWVHKRFFVSLNSTLYMVNQVNQSPV